jgi:hypothetical protein
MFAPAPADAAEENAEICITGHRIDGRHGVRALMRVRADHDHPGTFPSLG